MFAKLLTQLRFSLLRCSLNRSDLLIMQLVHFQSMCFLFGKFFFLFLQEFGIGGFFFEKFRTQLRFSLLRCSLNCITLLLKQLLCLNSECFLFGKLCFLFLQELGIGGYLFEKLLTQLRFSLLRCSLNCSDLLSMYPLRFQSECFLFRKLCFFFIQELLGCFVFDNLRTQLRFSLRQFTRDRIDFLYMQLVHFQSKCFLFGNLFFLFIYELSELGIDGFLFEKLRSQLRFSLRQFTRDCSYILSMQLLHFQSTCFMFGKFFLFFVEELCTGGFVLAKFHFSLRQCSLNFSYLLSM